MTGSALALCSEETLDYDALMAEADRRFATSAPDALRAASSLVERSPGDTVLARDVGYSAMEWGLEAHAYHLFKRVASARPYEPQTYLAMAQCLRQLDKTDLAVVCYEIALSGRWPARFGQFRKIVALDYLALLQRIAGGRLDSCVSEFAEERLSQLRDELGLERADLVIAITWNTDATDIDLHVVEPTGEKCFYRNPKTKIGGELTRDVTRGYGPEMYVVREAAPGEYRVKARLYRSDDLRTSVRTKTYATIYERWGRPDERVTRKAVTLTDSDEVQEIAAVRIGRQSACHDLCTR